MGRVWKQWWWSGKCWRIIYKLFSLGIIIFFVCALVSCLPKPSWMCSTNQSKGKIAKSILSDTFESKFLPKTMSESANNIIDFYSNKILRLFPIYAEPNLSDSEVGGGKLISKMSTVKVFHLQNFNFSNFGRTWLNELSDPKLNLQNWRNENESEKYLQFMIEMLQHQILPDCVSLRVPHGAKPTKICVHFPSDDNFISNRLRDTGLWEMELVFQMEDFFRNNPQSQLVDLGCNVGVFTLFAASLGKPALAVDILPSNLALVHLSIIINDNSKYGKPNDDDIEIMLNSLGYNRKYQPKFLDLITTVHNAIYSKHTKMYVYLKNDPNLGGTEVKELNMQEHNSIIYKNNKHVNAGKESQDEKVKEVYTKETTSVIDNTQIIVDSVCLDDLIPYVRANLSVFLKMDIEGSEPDAFLCASNFFMHVDIRVILMEILFHRYSQQGKKMVSFLLNHNMVPSEDVNGRKLLDTDLKSMYKWPENIFWIKVR